MRITFVLPGFVSIPMGGVKVVHEYANRLAQRGHNVTLIYPLRIQTNALYQLKKAIIKLFDHLNGSEKTLYYTPGPKVAVLVVKTISPKYIPDGDAVIAAGWQTAVPVAELPESCGKKFYFLQHFETYFKAKKQVLNTFQLPMTKIAIAQWIIDELEKIGLSAVGPIANAINSDEYFIESNSSERNNDVIATYHHMNVKGPKDLIKTLKLLKKRKNIKATVISSRKPVHRFPAWVKIILRPSVRELRKLYNSSRVFLHTSHSEGWGLPVMEAMACGCAVVAAANGGVQEYLVHEKNALLAPIRDVRSLADNIQLILENEQMRKTLSENAVETVKKYDWNNSVDKFEKILEQENAS